MTIPLITEDENPNLDEVEDDGLGTPEPPVTDVPDDASDDDHTPDSDDGSETHEEDEA